MEKASIKHLDFQLQREKARSKDLEVECKALHAQIAQLEQDKAGLRREKLVLSEDLKKIAKLDDRVHFLQKEIESRDAIIASERAAAEQARAETDEVRNNANASIAQWVDAEKQWTAEQEALNEAATRFRNQIDELEAALRAQKSEFSETARLLEAERDRLKKMTEMRDALEAEMKNSDAHTERLRTKNCDLEQTIYKLNIAGDKQKEAIDLKETEIQTLKAALDDERKTVEKMELTINSLNDRVNAVKMVSLEDKGENQKLRCDLSDKDNEIARLTRRVDTLKRDFDLAAQSQESLQKTLDETREKCRQQQEKLKEKTAEILRHELKISQLTVELKKSENQGGEWSFQNSSLEAELQRTKEALNSALSASDALSAEKSELVAKVRQLQDAIETKDEEMVLLESQADEKVDSLKRDIRNLEEEVAARQSVIKDLTDQLNSTSEKNAVYHTKILEESETTTKFKNELAQMQSNIHAKERNLFLCEREVEKLSFFASWVSDWYSTPQLVSREWFGEFQAVQRTVAELQQQNSSLLHSLDVANATVAELHGALQEKERTIAHLEQRLEEDEGRIAALTATQSERQEQVAALQVQLGDAARQIDTLTTEANALNEQIILKEAAMEELQGGVEAARSRARTDLDAASHLQSCAAEFFSDQVALLSSLWHSRACLLADFATTALAREREEKAQVVAAKERVEATCRELTAFAKEAKAAMSKGDRAIAERQESLLSRIALLEGQAALLQREKEQAATQLSALVRRFEDAQRAHESARKDLQAAVEAEQLKCAAANKDATKLRSALNYEVARKCEYKTALERAKKLLGESEEMRAADSARALDAIRKANKESNYWVLCFDRLKGMVEQSRSNGKRLPSIDADTIHRLEEAKSNIKPMQAQEVNLAISGAPKLKRLRDEGGGVTK